MKEKYIQVYGNGIIHFAEYLCDLNGGHLNYNNHDMVVYWAEQAETSIVSILEVFGGG